MPASLVANPRPCQWLRFEADGRVVVTPGKVDIGQGISTALAQIVARALETSFELVSVQSVCTRTSANEGMTSGSLSVQDSGTALRVVCAYLRALRPSAGYASLPTHIMQAPLGADALRMVQSRLTPEGYGRSTFRVDLPAKLRGEPAFIQDQRLPGMRYALVLRGPNQEHQKAVANNLLASEFGATSNANAQIVELEKFVAFVSDSLPLTMRLATVVAEQMPAPVSFTENTTDKLREFLLHSPSERSQLLEALSPSEDANAQTFEAEYLKTWNCHASIGPSCAIARYSPGSQAGEKFTVWTHSQGVFNLRRDIFLVLGERLGLPETEFAVKHLEGAGCYGHNGADDVALDAAVLAQHFPDTPIRVQWTRAQEFADAPFSPAMLVRVKASMVQGKVLAWSQTLWSNGHSVRPGRGHVPTLLAHRELYPEAPEPAPVAINATAAMGFGAQRNAQPVYGFASIEVANHRLTVMPIRSSAFRALGAIANVFAIESMMDQLALGAVCDPYAFRLRHLAQEAHAPMRVVLERLAQECDWMRAREAIAALPERARGSQGLGLAMARYKNSGAWCAVAARVSIDTEVRVTQLWVVADIGEVVNPDGACNQLEGAAIQSTSLALKEFAGFASELSATPSWQDYPILRFSEVPQVSVSLMDRPGAAFLGAGEAATAPTVAAIANAVAHAIGVPVRQLPLTFDAIRSAIEA
jgi:CO/xanthine dehydrogenase Mo-binding subunit